jgi:hypothetical protein
MDTSEFLTDDINAQLIVDQVLVQRLSLAIRSLPEFPAADTLCLWMKGLACELVKEWIYSYEQQLMPRLLGDICSLCGRSGVA